MKKALVVGIIVLLIVVGLSGCTEKTDTSGDNGETNLIEIVDYETVIQRYLFWDEDEEGWALTDNRQLGVPWDLDISDITTNLSKRQYICENYLTTSRTFIVEEDGEPVQLPGTEAMIWGEDYWNFSTISGNREFTISNFRLDTSICSWKVKGTAKNLADYQIVSPEITVYAYDADNNLLDSASESYENISAGATWDFDILKSYLHFEGEVGLEGTIDHVSFSTNQET